MAQLSTSKPNDLGAVWMPFTANRQFRKTSRMVLAADRMHSTISDGRKVLAATAGLQCVNAGPFGTRPTGVDHIRHAQDFGRNAFLRRDNGIEFADDRPGNIQLSPPLIIEKSDIDFIFETLGSVLNSAQ